MGLSQTERNGRERPLNGRWALPVAVAILAVFVAVLGDTGREWLSFDRDAIANGQLWRLATGHVAHLGWPHTLLNVAGLFLVWYLVAIAFNGIGWLLVLLVCVVGVDLGLWFLNSGLNWYVGLSGVLHGLLAAGIVGLIRSGRIDIVLLAVILLAKLAYEQLVGPLPGSESTTGGTVIVDAHAWGAFAGAIAAAISIRVRSRTPI